MEGIPVWVDNAGLEGFWEVELLKKVLTTEVAINYEVEPLIYCAEWGKERTDLVREPSVETYDQLAVPEKDCWKQLCPWSMVESITSAPFMSVSVKVLR